MGGGYIIVDLLPLPMGEGWGEGFGVPVIAGVPPPSVARHRRGVRPKGGGTSIDDYTGYYAKHDRDSLCFLVAKLHDFWGFSLPF